MTQQQFSGERLLGEVIEEERGKVTSRRVIDAEKMKIEHNFTSMSKIRGVEGTNMGKYVSQAQPDGSLYGEGEGIFMSQDGEAVSWKGQGLGAFTGPGKVRFRGSLIYTTQSKGKLASMNNVFGVFEHFGDMEGEMTSTVWEWK
jgi:hypothetical protein